MTRRLHWLPIAALVVLPVLLRMVLPVRPAPLSGHVFAAEGLPLATATHDLDR